MHPISRSETCLTDPFENEAHFLVEVTRVTVRCHLDARHTLCCRKVNGVAHECSTYAELGPVRVDEEVLELTDMFGDQQRRKANDPVIDDSYSKPLLGNRDI